MHKTSTATNVMKRTWTCEIFVYRDGKLIHHVKPYSTASLFEKFLFKIGLINLSRGVE